MKQELLKLIGEIPTRTIVFRSNGIVYTAEQMMSEIEQDTELGHAYGSDLLRVCRDFLKRQANTLELGLEQKHVDYILEHKLYLEQEKMLRYVFENVHESPLYGFLYLRHFTGMDLKEGKDITWDAIHKFKTERGDPADSFGQGLDD